MQYWQPSPDVNVGDAMPFWDNGIYRLYYLIDRGHHSEFHGLGGHQWAHASTTDLRTWEHHPLAVPRGKPGEVDQYGICTGSVFRTALGYEAWYATRTLDVATPETPGRHVTERVCVAASNDAIHFAKSPDNPLLSPAEGYHPPDFRDPCVFRHAASGLYHLLVTARLEPHEPAGRGGCLAHYVSADRLRWRLEEPFLVPGELGVPECPDLFEWNGWWYLTYLIDGWTRYRLARSPLGPWERPAVETVDGPGVNAMKSAAFGSGRRLGAGFLATRGEGRDDGPGLYAGLLHLRELTQNADGTLATRWVDELVPLAGAALAPAFAASSGELTSTPGQALRVSGAPLGVATATGLPPDLLLSGTLRADGATRCGLVLRGAGGLAQGYALALEPAAGRVSLARTDRPTAAVDDLGWTGLDQPVAVRVVASGDVIDVELAGRRCLVRRFPELRGGELSLFAQDGAVELADLQVHALG